MVDAIASQAVQQKQRKKKKEGREEGKEGVHKILRETLNEGGEGAVGGR
jgi:hypothetical protein